MPQPPRTGKEVITYRPVTPSAPAVFSEVVIRAAADAGAESVEGQVHFDDSTRVVIGKVETPEGSSSGVTFATRSVSEAGIKVRFHS